MERRQEDIVMLNDILDYLNNYEARTLLELSRTKLEGIEAVPQAQWERGTITDHRQLVSIRQALLARLGLPGDEDRWIKR
jgi:hypothetical protein